MASKSNIRSMRFRDEIIEMIESQAGDTFTAKFEALVQRCMFELPRKERELKSIQDQIERERQRLKNVQEKAVEIENHAYRLSSMIQGYCNQVNYTVKSIENKLEKE